MRHPIFSVFVSNPLAQVFYAIKYAVQAARRQNLGCEEYFEMRMPATSERIRMYCADSFAADATSEMLGTEDNASAIKVYQPRGTY